MAEWGSEMKAILKFDLPEDNDEYFIHIHSVKFFSALHDMDGVIRNKLKHSELSEETIKALEEIRSLIPPEVFDVG